MPRHSGSVQLTSTAGGKRLTLTVPNPTPPPPKNEVWTMFDPPAWLWEIAVGNAGRPMTVDVDEKGAPTVASVA